MRRKQKRNQKCPSIYFVFLKREGGEYGKMKKSVLYPIWLFCLVWGVGFGFVFFCFLFSAGSFLPYPLPYCDGKERREGVGWQKVHGAVFAVGTKVSWNWVFVLFIQFAALFSLAMLNQKIVSVRNILKLWHTVIWTSFPVAMFQGWLGLHYWYQLKEVLLFSRVDTAGKGIKKNTWHQHGEL